MGLQLYSSPYFIERTQKGPTAVHFGNGILVETICSSAALKVHSISIASPTPLIWKFLLTAPMLSVIMTRKVKRAIVVYNRDKHNDDNPEAGLAYQYLLQGFMCDAAMR